MFRWLRRAFRKKGPAIQALDSIDIIGERHDGGVDLAIVNSDPSDASPETRRLLREKIAGYLHAIHSDDGRSYRYAYVVEYRELGPGGMPQSSVLRRYDVEAGTSVAKDFGVR